ncbi:MAG: hypothetical protein ACRECY_03735 [Phyllobacterium sp.]
MAGMKRIDPMRRPVRHAAVKRVNPGVASGARPRSWLRAASIRTGAAG